MAQNREWFRHIIQDRFKDYFSIAGDFPHKPNLEAQIFTPNWQDHSQLPNTLSMLAKQGEGDLLLQQLDLAGFVFRQVLFVHQSS